MIWINVESRETTPQKSKSYINHDEISVVQQVVPHLLEARPWAKIAVLTFYKGQFDELMKHTSQFSALQVSRLQLSFMLCVS
jgi:hypothetical protein